jgi:hypothetical protein
MACDNWARGFVRSWLSEADGTVSNTRVCISALIAFALGWVTALVVKVHGPVTVAEIGALLGPLGLFVGGISGSLYGINKFADAMKSRQDAPPAQQ